MACPNCGKSDKVTIGNRNYCANCGAVISDADVKTPATKDASPAPVAPVAATPTPPPPPAPPAPPPPVATATPAQLTDIKKPSDNPPADLNPANQFHGQSVPAAKVLDLRQVAPTPVAPEPKVAPPAVEVKVEAPEPKPIEPTVSTASAAINAIPIKAVAASLPQKPAEPAAKGLDAKQTDRLAKASAVPQSGLIKRFLKHEAKPAATVPEPAPAAPAPPPMPPPPMPAVPPTPAPTPPAQPGPSQLPNAVATQIDANKALASVAVPVGGTGLKPTSVAAVAVAIALMGGYIWVRNYPNMALRVASAKAGIEASLPAYLPTTYNLAGPISYSPGQVTLHFNSGSAGSLTLSQARTSWDSGSLLENFVSKQTNQYLAVQNQGLTIYLYNGNQASWVNRGVWYNLQGDTHLNREQILKIVESL